MGGIVVLGPGYLGRAVVAEAASSGPVAVRSRSTHPALAELGPAAAAVVREAIEEVDATAVIDTVGLLPGKPHGERHTDGELQAANADWPRWLATEALANSGVRLVHAGSAAEYGDPGSAHPVSEDRPAAPEGIYGTTKWAGTQAVLEARAGGLDATVARVFNLVGPAMPPSMVLRGFVDGIENLPERDQTIQLWDATTTRDFVTVDDAAAALVALARAPEVPDLVNVCSGTALSFGDIVLALAARRGRHDVRVLSEGRPGNPIVIGDPTRLAAVTGLRLRMDLDRLADAALGPDGPGPDQ